MAEIKRAKSKSKQPRFDNVADYVFGSILRWVKEAEIEEPPYGTNSMQRDAWLSTFWMREPHLAGVVNSVVLIDSNRQWTLTGGRNQVLRFSRILHSAENGAGWRHFIRRASLSYWTTDLGAIIEIGRDGRSGPLRALYNVDSARCRLTGNVDFPLEYHPLRGKVQRWRADDFLRVASLPLTAEAFHGLGFCALSRCLELAKLLLAVYRYDQEQLGARMPRGLLLLNNITEQQWLDSLNKREEELTEKERLYYGGVQVLASGGMEPPDARLVALSQLPAEFDREVFTNQLMYGYALAFGYDPSEFWPVQYGALGRGRETEIQHRKATGKGGLDFALAFQEVLQNELPDTIAFEFEQRDEEGEMIAAQLQQAKIAAVRQAYEAGLQFGSPLLSREEARQLLVEAGVIPAQWTEAEEKVQVESEEREADDTPPAAEDVENEAVQRAAFAYPDEPIVRYRYPTGRWQVIARRGSLLHPRRIAVPEVKRATVLYQGDGWQITDEDVTAAIEEGRRRLGEEFAQLLTAPVYDEVQHAD